MLHLTTNGSFYPDFLWVCVLETFLNRKLPKECRNHAFPFSDAISLNSKVSVHPKIIRLCYLFIIHVCFLGCAKERKVTKLPCKIWLLNIQAQFTKTFVTLPEVFCNEELLATSKHETWSLPLIAHDLKAFLFIFIWKKSILFKKDSAFVDIVYIM